MYPVTKTTADNFKTNALQYLSVLVNPVTGSSFEITSADVLTGGLSINRYSANGDSVALGSCVAAELNLRLENGDGRFDSVVFEGAQLVVSVGTPDGDNIAWIPLGYFTVDNAPRRLAIITLTALDSMVQFDKEVNMSALNLPTTVKNLVIACCNECNVILATDLDTLPNKDYSVVSVGEQENLTYRSILAWCCQIMGVCGFMDWQGHLELSWYKKSGIPETVSGEIAVFESNTVIPVTSLSVPLTAVQDLNGYDHPWPAGGGVNKFDVDTATVYNRYINTAGNWLFSSDSRSYAFPCEPSTTYTVSCDNANITVFRVGYITEQISSSAIGVNRVDRKTASGSTTITTGANATYIIVQISAAVIDAGTAKLQIELGSTAHPWQPYSNICPIYPGNGRNLVGLAHSPAHAQVLTSVTVDSQTDESVTFTSSSATYACFRLFYHFTKGTYTVTFSASSSDSYTPIISLYRYSSPWNLLVSGMQPSKANTFTFTEDMDVDIRMFATTSPATVRTVTISNLQFERGIGATQYVPYQNVAVTKTGINIWDEQWELGGINVTTGENAVSTQGIRSKYYIPVLPNETYYAHVGNGNLTLKTRWYDANRKYIGSSPTISYNQTFTVPADAHYLRFCPQDSYGATYNNDISINYPSTDHEYHAYVGTTYPISIGQDVYGGTLDVTTGVLTVTHGMVDLGALDWTLFTTSGQERWYSTFNDALAPSANTVQADIKCSQYKSVTFIDVVHHVSDAIIGYSSSHNIGIYDSGKMSLTEGQFKTAMNGVQFYYPLATPVTYQLTPTEVRTLIGQNNLWSTPTGTISVTFPAIPSITPADRYNSDIYENAVTITGVQVKGKENQALYGTDDYALNIDGNNLIADEDCETIANGLSSLVGFTYHPFSASTLPMPYLYPLDMVAVQYKDEWYDCALTEINFTATSPTEMKGTGESAQTKSYARINPLTNRERAIIESVKTEVNTTLNKAINNLLDFNQIISNALGLYHTNVSDGQGGFIRYLHDAPDLDSSTYIVTETAQGFAWTNNGWNGGSPVWSYGVTSGGYALFKWLSAEGIDVAKASSDYRAEVTPEHFNIYYKSDLIITIDATERAIKTPRLMIPYSSSSNNMLRVGQLVWMPTPNGANAVVLGS